MRVQMITWGGKCYYSILLLFPLNSKLIFPQAHLHAVPPAEAAGEELLRHPLLHQPLDAPPQGARPSPSIMQIRAGIRSDSSAYCINTSWFPSVPA